MLPVMRHFRCAACQKTWEFEDSTVKVMGAALMCPACNGMLAPAVAVSEEDTAGSDEAVFLDRFLGAPSMGSGLAAAGRFGLWCFIVYYSIQFYTLNIRELGQDWSLLHGVNLIFHEAGHWIFGIFGMPLLTSLGGTLGQLLMPAILGLAFFFKNKDCYAAGLGLWWFGENLVDCAPYINDARALQLMLLGGGTGKEVEGHDWEFILGQLGLINEDIYIARDVLLAGRIVMAVGLLWMLVVVLRQVPRCLRKKSPG